MGWPAVGDAPLLGAALLLHLLRARPAFERGDVCLRLLFEADYAGGLGAHCHARAKVMYLLGKPVCNSGDLFASVCSMAARQGMQRVDGLLSRLSTEFQVSPAAGRDAPQALVQCLDSLSGARAVLEDALGSLAAPAAVASRAAAQHQQQQQPTSEQYLSV